MFVEENHIAPELTETMKTAMQQLQEKITALINDSKGDDTRTGDYRIGLHQALSLIDLEAEKEQIMEAWDNLPAETVKKIGNILTTPDRIRIEP